jgi:tRNA (guanine-N7-)-methyltransferase
MNTPVPKISESLMFKPESWFEPLSWKSMFPKNPDAPVHVDLGAGDGGFIRSRAEHHPETNFIAVERLLGRARKISRNALKDHLENVKVLRIEAGYAVEWLFPAGSLTSITVLFPDPWPKRRHHKNRIIQPDFLKLCAKCLRPDGWLGIKTDHGEYFEHIQECLNGSKEFRIWDIQSENLLPELTDFEREFIQSKRKINFIAGKLR